MAWGKHKSRETQPRGKHKTRKGNGATAGAFRTKTPGLYVASFKGKWFRAALSVFKQAAQEDDPAVVVFIRKTERHGPSDPVLSLGLAVSKPFRKNRISDDPDDDPEMDDLHEDDADDEETEEETEEVEEEEVAF